MRSRPSGRDGGTETLVDKHAALSPPHLPPLQTTSQLCAHLSQSTSVTPVELPALLSVTVRVEHSTAEPGQPPFVHLASCELQTPRGKP